MTLDENRNNMTGWDKVGGYGWNGMGDYMRLDEKRWEEIEHKGEYRMGWDGMGGEKGDGTK